jgi:hypothetical protein
MKPLTRLYFLIHGFCYAEMTRGTAPVDARLRPYLERERRCAEHWRERLTRFTGTDALVVVPTHPACGDTLNAYLEYAKSLLGDRLFLLDCPDAHSPDFWDQGDDFGRDILRELQPAFVQHPAIWNREEVETHLHCLACHRQLSGLLQERGYVIDTPTALGKAWGASFEGCVTKYTVTFRHLLGLAVPIGINFNLTVPDAAFLLNTFHFEWVELTENLRVYLFHAPDGPIALYCATSHSLADSPASIALPPELSGATVLSKQGTRLWPQPEVYQLTSAPPEYFEPAQQVVNLEDGCLRIPVSSGFVYRLAKAPAYVFAPEGMGRWELVRWLQAAVIVKR